MPPGDAASSIIPTASAGERSNSNTSRKHSAGSRTTWQPRATRTSFGYVATRRKSPTVSPRPRPSMTIASATGSPIVVSQESMPHCVGRHSREAISTSRSRRQPEVAPISVEIMPRISTPFDATSTAADVVAGIDLDRQARDRHRRRVGHRDRDRPSAGRRGRRGHAGGTRRGRRPPYGAGHRRVHREQERRGGAARSRRTPFGRRVRGLVGGAAAHPRRQRRRHGLAADAYGRGVGDAVRDQPPWTLRVANGLHDALAAGRRRPHRLGQLRRAPALAGRVRGHPLPRARVRTVARLRAVQDRQHAVRRRGHPALGRRRHHRQRPAPGRHPHQPRSGT